MTKLALTTTTHSQSHNTVDAIKVLDKTFVYSDSRGFSTSANIDSDFAMEVINDFPVKMGRGNVQDHPKPVLFMDRLNKTNDIILKWNRFDENRFELMIHCGSSHVWTSDVLNINND